MMTFINDDVTEFARIKEINPIANRVKRREETIHFMEVLLSTIKEPIGFGVTHNLVEFDSGLIENIVLVAEIKQFTSPI